MDEDLMKKSLEFEYLQKCPHYAAVLCKQLNQYTNSYALKYPDCQSLGNCDDCPYTYKKKNIAQLSAEEKKNWITSFNRFYVSPENILHKELNEEQGIKLYSEFFDNYRTLFRKEEERIIYTEAFRRLQYKTQVMINSASDDQRTRLLHSLEVQKISRKIAVALRANYELTDAIAIAHDIGHAPFGHAGERTIKLFLENQMAGSFSHALQSVKVVDFLCSHRALKPMGLKGLGVSDLVLEGILKHDSDSFSDNMASAAFRLQYECDRLYKPVGVSSSEYNDREVYIGGIETQIVCWADKIAYMSHDWEEFVEVGLLEVMLSRINEIVIQINDFTENFQSAKYTYISDIESKQLCAINKAFDKLKQKFYSEHYSTDYHSSDDTFVKVLCNLIAILQQVVNLQQQFPNSFVLLSNEQYKLMHSFFNVAYAWIIITKVKPKNIGGKIDIIFVIYKYLCETTAHRTVPALIEALVSSCNAKLNEFNKEHKDNKELIKYCNNLWQENKKRILGEKDQTILCADDRKEIKKELKKSFIVSFNDEYENAVSCISNFIYEEFIESTRVRFMTQKAEMIINKLLEFYSANYHMLPLKYRKRIQSETSIRDNIERTKFLLKDYYWDRIQEALLEDSLSNKDDHKHLKQIKKIIKDKIPSLRNGSELPLESVEFKNQLFQDIDSNEMFAKEAIRLRIIADYISGMTDRMAEKKYNEICSSSTQWSRAFTERGTFNI